MLIIEKKKHHTSYITVWYAEQKLKKKGIIRYRSAKEQICKNMVVRDTFLSDLTLSEEDILSKYAKNCRYEIRRAAKEDVVCDYKIGKELTDKDIEEFAEFFSDFWKSKGILTEQKEKYESEIREYVKQEGFAISVAKIDDKILVYHTYIIAGDMVRLYQSASQFRKEEKISSQVIGRANRYLHKEDMLFFKKRGFKLYDWGGAGKGEDVASITKFKASFGGNPAIWYDGETVNGWVATVLKLVIVIWGKVRK